MKLHFHPMSQHSRRVRMLCFELGITPELLPVAIDQGEHKSEAFLRLNPAHAVPVLDDEGFILAESHAIMRYLCQKCGGERFYPASAQARAAVDQWLDWTHCRLNPPIQTLAIQILFAGKNRDSALVERAQNDAREALTVLELALPAKRGIGGETSLSDLAIATTLALYELCQGSFETTPRAKAYYEKLKRLASFKATAPQL